MKTYIEGNIPLIIAMDTQLVVLRIKHQGRDLFLNKEFIHLHPCPIGFTFKFPKARFSFKVK
jgi:hypothetical protein